MAGPDRATVIALNDAEQPAVTPLPCDLFEQFVTEASVFTVAEMGERLAGFLVALPAGLDYRSVNYRWFAERYDDIVYVDRIVVAPYARRAGVGRALYEDLAAREPEVGIGCEVNLDPPNPGSTRFHHALGFREVGRQHTDYGRQVSMMRWDPRGG